MNYDTFFTFSISLNELLTALSGSGRAMGFVVTDNITLPPSFSLTLNIPVTPITSLRTLGDKFVALPLQFVAQPDPDGVIDCKLYADKTPIIDDNGMVAQLYATPVTFLKDFGFIIYAKDSFKAVFTNNDSVNSANISFRFVYGIMLWDDFRNMIANYMERIKDWLISKSLR